MSQAVSALTLPLAVQRSSENPGEDAASSPEGASPEGASPEGASPQSPTFYSSANDQGEAERSALARNARGKRCAVTACQNSAALRVAAQAEHTDESIEAPLFTKVAEAKLKKQLDASGHGSALRGWRWLFDPDGTLEVPWLDLESSLFSIDYVHNEEELSECLQNTQGVAIKVGLVQVLSELGVLVEMFRRWMTDSFGGQDGWFNALDADHTGNVTKENFMKLCRDEGFTVRDDELQELFDFCDISHKDYITRDLTIFLETDVTVRERELLKLKMSQRHEQNRILVSCYNDHVHIPIASRLAIRPWVRWKFEALPTIARQRIVKRDTAMRRNGLQARARFIRHLRSFHATEVRAWRRGIDTSGKFSVSRATFKQYCRKIQLEEDVNALWTCFDGAGEGTLAIEQFCLDAADVMATFRTWAHRSFGSCMGLFQTPEAIKRRQKKRADGSYFTNDSMSTKALASLLWAYGYPPLFGQDGDVILWYLIATLDFHGGSLILCEDLQWLDGWKPTEWLVAEPDNEEWYRIRAFLESMYGNLLRAWRRELDVDNSNKLTWTEWCEACRRLGIEGNLAGAWRAVDQRRVGYISFEDVCQEAAEVITEFKSWAEIKFSSMNDAFRAIDVDGGGSLSQAELKSGCFKFKCACNPQFLFDVMSSNGRNISRKDFNFLSDWVPSDQETAAELKTVTDDLWKEVFTSHHSRASSRPGSSWTPIRQHSTPVRAPSRFGSLAAAQSASSCIPADFALGTAFPVSPYSLSLKPRLFASKSHQRTQLRRSVSDTSIKVSLR